MNLLRLSISLLRRDWRAGEWRVLLIALVLAVGSIATVGLFADRIRLALQQEATSLLGADLRLTSTRPLPSAYRAAALQRGLGYNVPVSNCFAHLHMVCGIELAHSGS